MSESENYGDFEFERRFFVRELPEMRGEIPAVIVQSYLLADDGYAVRLRLQASSPDHALNPRSRADAAFDEFLAGHDLSSGLVAGILDGAASLVSTRGAVHA